MAWFRVDDKLHDHPKVRKLRGHKLSCLGLWTACGSWASDTLSDGFVPSEIVHRFDPDESLAKRLVEVGLWVQHEHDGEDGYLFHQWTEHQPTKADVERRREEARERMRKRRARGQAGSGSQDVRANGERTSPNTFAHDDANDVDDEPLLDDYSDDTAGLFEDSQVSDPVRANSERTAREVRHPDPTRPVVPNGTTTKGGPRKRGARIPEDFVKTHITPELVAWSRERCPDVDARGETERFVLWAESTSGAKGVKLDWVKAWKNWLLEEQKRQARRPSPRLFAVPQPTPLPTDAAAAFAALRERADAKTAADLIGITWVEPSQKPSDPTPYPQWSRARRLDFIDEHRDAICAALTARRTG